MRPNLRNLDLNLLVLFDAIMTEKQLTEAARRVGITQSAASQALARLRHKLSDDLFLRSRQGMLPTPTALRIAPSIREALLIIDKTLKQTAAFDPAISEREFRLAFGITGEPGLLAPILAAVGARGAGIKIRVVPGAVQTSLEAAGRGEIDFFFDYARPARKAKLNSIAIAELEMVVIARKSHPRIKGHISASQFFGEKHVVLTLLDERRAQVESMLQKNGMSRQVAAEVSHYSSVPPLVVETDAIATVPKSMADIQLYHGKIQVLQAPWTLPVLPLHLIWHPSLESDPGHAWLHQLIAEQCHIA